MSEVINAGLWKKEGDKGAYYSGSVSIDGQDFWVNLYRNDRKESDKHPDLNLRLKPKAESKPKAAAKPFAPIEDEIPF